MTLEIKRVLGTDFYWNTLIEDTKGRVWVGVFDHWSKKTEWRLKQ